MEKRELIERKWFQTRLTNHISKEISFRFSKDVGDMLPSLLKATEKLKDKGFKNRDLNWDIIHDFSYFDIDWKIKANKKHCDSWTEFYDWYEINLGINFPHKEWGWDQERFQQVDLEFEKLGIKCDWLAFNYALSILGLEFNPKNPLEKLMEDKYSRFNYKEV